MAATTELINIRASIIVPDIAPCPLGRLAHRPRAGSLGALDDYAAMLPAGKVCLATTEPPAL